MSIASQATQQRFPFAYDAVFDGLVTVLPRIGFSIANQDKVIGRVSAKTGMSLLSWGENITIVVQKIDEADSLVGIESSLKVGFNLAGAHRHSKNCEQVVLALSQYLQENRA